MSDPIKGFVPLWYRGGEFDDDDENPTIGQEPPPPDESVYREPRMDVYGECGWCKEPKMSFCLECGGCIDCCIGDHGCRPQPPEQSQP